MVLRDMAVTLREFTHDTLDSRTNFLKSTLLSKRFRMIIIRDDFTAPVRTITGKNF